MTDYGPPVFRDGSPLPPRLTSAMRKLQRARVLIKELRRSLEGYRARKPWMLNERVDEAGWTAIWSIVTEPPPVELGLILGDVVNNLRAVLDHLVYELTMSYSPSRPKLGEKSQFPICLTEKDFDDAAARSLTGVSPAARAFIGREQPFQERLRAARSSVEFTEDELDGMVRDEWLVNLQHLSNRDKHRNLLVTAATHRIVGASVHGDGDNIQWAIGPHGLEMRVKGTAPDWRSVASPFFELDVWVESEIEPDALVRALRTMQRHTQIDELAGGLADRTAMVLSRAAVELEADLSRDDRGKCARP